MFVVVYNVEGLPPGVYSYDIAAESLRPRKAGLFRDEMRGLLVGMVAPRSANWTIVLTLNFPQYQWRYQHERALRNLYIASGRIGQRLIVAAMAQNIGTLPTPAMKDLEMSALLGLDAVRESPVYTLSMGCPMTSSLPPVDR